MEINHFDVLWLKAILPCCQKTYNSLSADCINDYRVRLKLLPKLKHSIYDEYERGRVYVHECYFNSANYALIDKHKICACLIGTIIKCRPISYDLDKGMPIELFLSNYEIAFSVA